MSKLVDGLKCAIVAIMASLPLSLLFKLFYRFPIPFGDIEGGLQYVRVIHHIGIAWFFYGVFCGGFVVLGVAGVIAGIVINSKVIIGNEKQKNKLLIVTGILIATFGIAILSNLDRIIGPW